MEVKNTLVVEHLGKSYGGRRVVGDINLIAGSGEVVGLLGPNGAGKSTTFYMISGIVQPDYGAIFFHGCDITRLPMYRRARMGIGYLPQESSVFKGMTVEQNILTALELFMKDSSKRWNRLEELMSEFAISHLHNVSAVSLSGGERRRLEIARCLASSPKLILLDEPFAGIDPIAVDDIKLLVSSLKNKGIGVIITDHNVRETLGILDRAYIVYDGNILASGTPDEVVQHKSVRKVYLGREFSY